jgi:hypothetical protein
MGKVFAIAKREQIPTYVAADRMAEERIARVRGLTPRHWSRAVRSARRKS